MNKQYSIKPDQIIYLDSSSREAFFYEISNARVSEYYGSFLNDSTEIKKSEFLNENLSCIGRVLSEIDKNNQSINDSLLIINPKFKTYHFYSLSNGQQVNFNADSKIKVILLYSYSMGTYFNSFFKQIASLSDTRKNLKIFIISLDPLQALPS